MPDYPIGRGAYRDPVLSRYATKNFDVSQDGYAAPQLCVTVPVDKQSGIYNVFDPAGFMSTVDDLRAPLAEPNEVWFKVSSDTYYCPNRALQAKIPLEDLSNEDAAINLRQTNTDLLMMTLRRNQEVRVAQLATSSGGPGAINALTGASKWSAVGSADITGQVNSAHAAVWMRSGMRPNTVLIDWESWSLAKQNERLLAQYKFTAGGEMPDELLLKNVFKVQRAIIVDGLQNTANRAQGQSLSRIWGNLALFCVTNPGNPTLPNFLTRFRWAPKEGPYSMPAGETFSVFRTRRDQAGEAKVEILEAGYFQGEKVTGSELSYLIKDTI